MSIAGLSLNISLGISIILGMGMKFLGMNASSCWDDEYGGASQIATVDRLHKLTNAILKINNRSVLVAHTVTFQWRVQKE